MGLHRFWFEFDLSIEDSPPAGTLLGCGVSAYDYDDAINLIKERVFDDDKLPEITKEVRDVDVSTLDQNHVLPNMGIVTNRGIWFPLGYE